MVQYNVVMWFLLYGKVWWKGGKKNPVGKGTASRD